MSELKGLAIGNRAWRAYGRPPPARTGASTQVEARLKDPQVRLESLKSAHVGLRGLVLVKTGCFASLSMTPKWTFALINPVEGN